MDLGIKGRRAIVCGSSKGLGLACAQALADAGVEVVLNGRAPEPLAAAAEALAARIGRPVASVAADVTQAPERERLLAACPEPDILITNAAGPAPGQFEDWGEAEWHAALQANMVAPLQLIRATIPAMRRRGWGRILNITSAAVKAPLPMLGLSTGARSGLTGAVASLAREAAADGVTINNVLPGHFDTDRLASVFASQAARQGISSDEARRRVEAANPARRVGRPEEFGAVCAFLASAHAGYINGQNLLIDGGAFPGVF
ncbi:MAG TPA: SDR family oxidoreductase [Phenylobacterium sp.]|jgi:3-oxoacyl-[acyl-carrier protein] reductase|uniref:SDR family oxidoreductase n=1 Tax=Phenylobacterium sp. TaxID=1871053 RepID=UPI002D356DE3|nr:SDR family oxidoreductase [Phenylobacterium sp.]HZZ69024.1 SDR family oxidoreductase [Phenylobacterium sp.]